MFDKNLMKLTGMRGMMMALVVLALLQAGAIGGQAYGLSRAIVALWQGAGLVAAVPDIALFAACFALLQLVRFAQETMLDRFSLDRAKELRDAITARTFGDALLAQRVGAARVAAIANDGIDDVQTYLRIIPPKIIGMAAISVPLLVCEFVVDWPSGVILALMFPVIIFFMRLLGRQAREQSERQYATYTRLTNRFMDTLRGLPVLKAFGATEAEGATVYESSEGLRRATVRTLRTATLSSAVLDLCATFGTAAVAIMLAFRLMDGSITLFTGLFALIIAPEYFTPIRSFASDYHASLDGKNALADVLSLLEAPAASRSTAIGLAQPQAIAADEFVQIDSISFEGVSFRYGEGAEGEGAEDEEGVSDTGADDSGGVGGLDDITFTLNAGEKLGVVGRSGAGKSTLANLFAGFMAPTAGTVRVNGEELDLTGDAWKAGVRYIPQAPYIFRATLAENICFYNPHATRESIDAAVQAVGLAPLVAELPEGLDTLVGEGARGLSGGEAHRVALARILLDSGVRVLVFDEPTAHLDIETERDLKEPMLRAMEGKTVLFATHRLHWMQNMDRVITLEGGRIAKEVRA